MKVNYYFQHGLAPSTQRTYSAPQRQFIDFCTQHQLQALPASQYTLQLFAAHLAQRLKPQSIPVYLAAVRALHIAHGFDNPLKDTLQLKQTLRGISRVHGEPPTQKLPITFDILKSMRPFINVSLHDDLVCWAAMVTAHFFFLRCGEFTVSRPNAFSPASHLTVADLQLKTSSEGHQYVALRLKTSKTDQFRRGHILYAGHSSHLICPVCIASQLLALYNESNTPADSTPLFALDDGSALSRPVLLKFVSQRLRLLGFDPLAYGGHSFRVGGATSAASAGLNDYEIKTLGRWSSDCYRRYIRTPISSILQLSSKIAKSGNSQYSYANPYDI